MKNRNLLIGQSGGPTAVINASLAGVVDFGLNSGCYENVLGAVCGIYGILAEDFIDLKKFKDPYRISILKQTPSSYLGSCRYKLTDDGDIYEKIFNIFQKHNIGTFVYIGGNDSMDTVDKLSKYAKVHGIDVSIVGVPKTIDNDLILTDHTPGYASAAKYVANSIRQLAIDASVYRTSSIIVAEMMGRNAGWLTAAAALANDDIISPVDIICLPEKPFDARAFLDKTADIVDSKKTTVIAVSEGICNKAGEYVTADITSRSKTDGFQHIALGGVGRYIENLINTNLGVKTRSIEFSTLQRCNAQTASLCDINEAFEQGRYGAKLGAEGACGVMIGITRGDTAEYKPKITSFDVSLVANKEKQIPDNMLSEDGFGVTDDFIRYALPLIQGEPDIIYKNGLIQFENRSKK